MKWPIHIYLNIRQKVTVGMTVAILAIGLIGGFSYRYLLEIEKKQLLVEIADDLRNIILEVRRYEKNYLLYNSMEDLQENQSYVRSALDLLARIGPEFKFLEGATQLRRIESEFHEYAKLMEQMADCARPKAPACDLIEEKVRELGKSLVELSQWLVIYERNKILDIIKTLKSHLVSNLIIFLFTGGLVVFFVNRKIIRPLKTIETTTHRIARGDLTPLPVGDLKDETRQVVEAFNRMISELENRQDQLVQAQKLSSIGILASGIAHQLNNPLNNISTSCQILMEEFGQADPAFLKRLLTNSEQEIHRAKDIVKGLLEFSRDRDFQVRPCHLKDVVSRSVRLISSQVPSGVDVETDVPDSLIAELDSQRMQEVFLNLVMNAVHAMETLPGQIRIAASEDPVGGTVKIVVSDTGKGIPASDLGRIFDPFFSTKEVGEGTGLGLSIVYGIIRQHQGTISVESKPGEGTRFTIRLPLGRNGEKEASG